jgi:coiled-coil domain-containing protein 55
LADTPFSPSRTQAEAEAHLYEGKEKFVTAAYRRKLAAREAYEADQKEKAADEARRDVTKQDGLMAFHRNLLNDNLEGEMFTARPFA